MSIIEATTLQIKTMRDGTLRLTVDISPTSAQDAFKLFGAPDTPIALAALTQEAAKQSAMEEMIEADKPKGGELARLAGMWCTDPKFWEWMAEKHGAVAINETDAAKWMRHFLSIPSRATFDYEDIAAKRFHERIRIPYSEWLRTHA